MSRLLAVALIVGGLAGCQHSARVRASSVKRAPKPEPQLVAASRSLGISSDLLEQCMVRISDTATTPRFDYDEATLLGDDRMVLDAIGKCVMHDGPLAGRALQLVGRADPRGTQEYNLALGTRRAGVVTDYLARLGVAHDQLAPTTRGDLDATGREDVGWRNDRRVDITLMEDLEVSAR